MPPAADVAFPAVLVPARCVETPDDTIPGLARTLNLQMERPVALT